MPVGPTPDVIVWTGSFPLASWTFRAGNFFALAAIEDGAIKATSAVVASVSEVAEPGDRTVGDTVLYIGAVAPRDGGVDLQVGTDSLNPAQLRLAVTLMVVNAE
jgi:hypothetical protein